MNNSITNLPFDLVPGYAHGQIVHVGPQLMYLITCGRDECLIDGRCCGMRILTWRKPLTWHQIQALRCLRDEVDATEPKYRWAYAGKGQPKKKVLAVGAGYAHVGLFSRRENADTNVGTAHTHLRYWGLANLATRPEEIDRWRADTDGAGMVPLGMWRITSLGRAFLGGTAKIPQTVLTANGEIIGYAKEPRMIGIGDIQE